MTRAAAFTFAIILGFLVVGLLGVMFLLLFPYDQFIAPPPTVTFTPTAIPVSTATVESFLPTARLETPTSSDPTATSTRVPTVTPGPTRTPTEPVAFPTRVPPRPTATPELAAPAEPGTPVPTATLPPQREVVVQFKADPATLDGERCTKLVWQVTGPVTVQLEGETVPPSGTRQVCPGHTTDYTLTVQEAGSTELIPYQVRVNVN